MRVPREVVFPGFRWFALRVEGAFEKKAARVLELYGGSRKIPDFDLVKCVWVPQMCVLAGSIPRRFKRVTILPGYLLIEAILSRELLLAFRSPSVPHVFGWLRFGEGLPSELPFEDIRALASLERCLPEVRGVSFSTGSRVNFVGLGMSGEVVSSSSARLVAEVSIFNQRVPIQVHRDQFSRVVRVEQR